MGRDGWFDETMRFYDRYVAGKPRAAAPVENDPPIALQDNSGKWRSEASWPPRDSFTADASLKAGSYTDDATNNGMADTFPPGPMGVGVWTFSPAFAHAVHFAGVPRITADVTTQGPEANFTAAIYDVDDKNNATLISRGTYLLPGSGKIAFDMYGNDWRLPAGHRFGVLISSSHAEWWSPTPTFQTVTVKSASMAMPYLTCERTATIQGTSNLKLEGYLKDAPFSVTAATVKAGTSDAFPLPGPLNKGCSAAELAGGPAAVSAAEGGGTTPAGCVDRRKFAFRIHQPRKSRIVRAVAYIDGKRSASKRGKRVTQITVARLPQKTFTLKIVATAANGQKTVSVRRYRGCKKGRPSTTVRPPRRAR
jgi:hypothetical protein